ncbi:MAG: biopolymer transporter ExbD, partial [Steroidobacteraceae bacterium]
MSMSNRARRMAQHHMRHRADAGLNLIPLIDILTVMVAFLLVYSTEVEVIQNAKGIEIPQSIAQT